MGAFFVGLVRSLALRPLEPLVDALGHYALQTNQGQPVPYEQGEEYEHAEPGQNDHDGEEESEEFHSALR
ncbi:MAG: hypothetical protein RL206_14 [Bacteroidota bacterium]